MKKIRNNPLGRGREDRETCYPEAAGEATRSFHEANGRGEDTP